jgi:hypothetical protein
MLYCYLSQWTVSVNSKPERKVDVLPPLGPDPAIFRTDEVCLKISDSYLLMNWEGFAAACDDS